MRHIVPLFPTPVMVIPGLLPDTLTAALAARLVGMAGIANGGADRLMHTGIVAPESDALFRDAAARIAPEVACLGEELFGERMPWTIKEMWGNVLERGGHQPLHNHANCFISGVAYLTPSHPSANTVFTRTMGERQFVFENTHEGTGAGPFNARKWIAPDPAPGDVLLFPSYLLHEVPVNQGDRRLTLAFNAIPRRLDAWGYATAFAAA
jgi:uncharacterized protein (TIGR02466 family)